MKKIVIAAALAACCAVPASAADIPPRGPTVMLPVVYNWSGFYIGAHTGGVWGKKDWSVSNTQGIAFPIGPIGSHDLDGWIAGAQIGFNYQFSRLVLGIEGQWAWTNAEGAHICDTTPSISCTTELNWIGSAAARVGLAWDRVLLYVKGGAAWANDDFSIKIAGTGTRTNGHTRTGWMVGGGVEFGLTSHFSGKIEYNYMDLGDKEIILGTFPVVAHIGVDQVMHVVKLGLNYRFGGGAVVANY